MHFSVHSDFFLSLVSDSNFYRFFVRYPEFGLKSFLCLCKKLLSYIYLHCEFCFVDKISSDTII